MGLLVKSILGLRNCLKFKLFILVISVLTACGKSKTEEVVNTITTENDQTPPKKAILAFQTNAALGEGAFWNYEDQELYWVDIEGKKLHIFNPLKNQNRTFPVPSRIGTVVPVNNQTAVIALEDGIYIINTQDGSIKLLSDVEANMPQNRFNDGKCDPNGNLWVGSMHFEQSSPQANLYKVDGNGDYTVMLDSVTISNGIVWTSDKKMMFYIDTPTKKIKAFDFDAEKSTITNERTAAEVEESLGFPDGMAIDENNNLWVGMWNGNSVLCFDPKTGKVIDKIEVPAHNVTSCAFGGENLDQLYITTASIDMTDDEKEKFPLAGSIFVAVPGVKGVKSSFFKTN